MVFSLAQFQAAIVDLDGTMVDTLGDFEVALNRALADLDEAYENSIEFKGYVPSDDISVYGALEELGANDIEFAFRRTLEQMYKFQELNRQLA